MSSAICFNMDQTKILSSGNGLTCQRCDETLATKCHDQTTGNLAEHQLSHWQLPLNK